MVQRIGQALGAALLVVALGVAARAETLEDVQKKIIEAADKVKSFSTEINMVIDMQGQGMSMNAKGQGLMEFMRKGDKNFMHMELKNSMVQKVGDQEMKQEGSILSISDGEYSYVLSEQGGQKTAMKNKMDPKESDVASKEMFAAWAQDNEVKLMPDEKIEGKDAYVIELTPKKPGGMTGKQLYSFGKDTGMLQKQVVMSQEGKPMQTTTFSNYKLGVEFKPERFVFKAPEGVEVMDMTKSAAPQPPPPPSSQPAPAPAPAKP